MSVTIIMAISRAEFLEPVFDALDKLNCDPEFTNLVTIVDGTKDLYIEARLKTLESKFNQRLCIAISKRRALNNIGARRKRIAQIHNEFKRYIPDCHYIMGVEDDTIIPPESLNDLVAIASEPNIGLVSGVEVGRWGVRYIGAWKANSELTELQTIIKEADIQAVDATGLYCFITRYDYYMNHEFKTFENNSLGCDVDFGLTLRAQGLENYVNWQVACGHYNKRGELLYPDKYEQLRYIKQRTTWRLTV